MYRAIHKFDKMAAVMCEDLCDNEKLLFEAIQKGNASQLISLMNGEYRVNCVDANGMSLLQHAAFKGNREICDVLLDAGADVNCNKHAHGYTALMFAALAGSEPVVTRLLEAGANNRTRNSVGRNAAQMAAFVGNHICVSLINNFIPRSRVEYYARPQGLETEGKLSRHLVTPLHRLLLSSTVHPVAVALFLVDHQSLYRGGEQAARVLRLMCEREFKRTDAADEVMAFKYHFLAFFVDACRELGEKAAAAAPNRKLDKSKKSKPTKSQANQDKETDGNSNEPDSSAQAPQPDPTESGAGATEPDTPDTTNTDVVLDDVIRHWLKTNDEDGVQENMEKLICAGIRDFPYPHCTIYKQLVRNLSFPSCPSILTDRPTALGLLTASVAGTGPRSEEDGQCETCGVVRKLTALKRCAACRAVRYCDQRCQRLHWPVHRRMCARLGEQAKVDEQLRKMADAPADTGEAKSVWPEVASSAEESDSTLVDDDSTVVDGGVSETENEPPAEGAVAVTEFEPPEPKIGDTSPEE